jgi:hypothetical protein
VSNLTFRQKAEEPGNLIIQALCVFFCTTPVARSTEFYYI